MKLLILTLSLFFTLSAHAEKVTCQLQVPGTNRIAVGSANEPYKAHSAAVESCVNIRSEDYEAKFNTPVTEERFSLFIDQCTTARCDD